MRMFPKPDQSTKPDDATCKACGAEVHPVWVAPLGSWQVADKCASCYEVEHAESAADAHRSRVDAGQGIPLRYLPKGFDSYRCPPGDADALDVVRTWTPEADRGLFITGPTGSGKTHLVYALARALRVQHVDPEEALEPAGVTNREAWVEAMRRRYPPGIPAPRYRVHCVQVLDVLRQLREGYGQDHPESAVTRPMYEAEVLVIDDLGTERSTEWAVERVHEVIEYRYSHQLPMVITSNSDLAELAEHYSTFDAHAGPRIASRLAEACRIVRVRAGDHRAESARA